MLDRSAANYGAPFTQTQTTQNPEEEQDAAQYNRHACDSAMLSIPALNWIGTFKPVADAAPFTVLASNVTAAGLSGMGPGSKPVVTKTGTGLYAMTFPASFVDDLGVTQTVMFRYAVPTVMGAFNGYARVGAVSGNVVTVYVYNTSNALSDLDPTSVVCVFAS